MLNKTITSTKQNKRSSAQICLARKNDMRNNIQSMPATTAFKYYDTVSAISVDMVGKLNL